MSRQYIFWIKCKFLWHRIWYAESNGIKMTLMKDSKANEALHRTVILSSEKTYMDKMQIVVFFFVPQYKPI